MFDVSRSEVRQFFFDVREKSKRAQPLTALEDMALSIISHHPEYHSLLDQPERFRDKDWSVSEGDSNPFLHLSLHLAIEEQLSIDQPPGIKESYHKLCLALKDEHLARHELLDALTEMVWQAEVNGQPLDNQRYLSLVAQKLNTLNIALRP
ncbi:MAG: hypothetical protein B7Z60_06020 [Ferrovum sp. 37-45-19]|uniref:DUF1841 family protein n=1 Tax=Ferrovum sp. JA12 TaxID=1356299 RepID=UPI000702494F|nr:DUF1841 family protein [Ferrovum sp. JA12]OYV79308.1 MAG: hypothetical protein B7Z65_06830 [Ferrovum sp. 21-44-67]OYV94137.1 MAG: hypothetical protein B7Z60_06020 [Ferrovum sp. 37-45-19]OZB34313.1 MAG: hypothetical protein B7X47_01055 [Ferrovum sp. 34-44-207]HQT81403.1 DUF1841 family protein [Ferrovaceae bacterium]KRH78507.1 hypothetical protein FERRO_14960 [Ferrovum sp. JA12]